MRERKIENLQSEGVGADLPEENGGAVGDDVEAVQNLLRTLYIIRSR